MTQRVLIKSKVSKKRALASDTDNDHFYGLQNQQIPKRRKLTKRVEAAKKREVEASAMAISGLDLVTEQGGRYGRVQGADSVDAVLNLLPEVVPPYLGLA